MQTHMWGQVRSLHGLSASGVSPQQAAMMLFPKDFSRLPMEKVPSLHFLHLSAGDPVVLHTFTHTERIRPQMGCTEQHIVPCGRRKRYLKAPPLGDVQQCSWVCPTPPSLSHARSESALGYSLCPHGSSLGSSLMLLWCCS